MNSAANDLPVALCVEDDSDLAYLLQFILEREGYAVAVACDGDSAQKWITAAAAPRALDAGASEYIVKPFKPEELRARIKRLMRKSP